MQRTARGQAGFTLVELLVSLMVLALVMSFVPGALRSGQRIWEADRRMDEVAALSSFRRYLEQRLAEAMPLLSRLPGRAVFMEFTGAPDRVAFVAPAPAGPARGGLYRFELLLEGGGPGGTLILRQSIHRRRQPGPDPTPAMERRLHGGINRLDLHYFGAPAPGEPTTWQDRWIRGDRLPDLIAITVSTGGSTERMVVPLRLAGAP